MVEGEARTAVVVNGNAKNVNEDVIASIKRVLGERDLFVSQRLEQAPTIAQKIVERGYGTVLTGGGDGTFTVMVTEVVKAAEKAGLGAPRFGVLKLGTGNALAWVVGPSTLGSKNRPIEQQELLRGTGSKKIQLVEVEGYLTPFAGLGADAQVLADYHATRDALHGTLLQPFGRGLCGYGVAAVTRSLPGAFRRPMPLVRIYNDGETAWRVTQAGVCYDQPIEKGQLIYEGKARIAALSTIPFYGFGMRLFPFADARSDRMNLRVSTLGSGQFVRHMSGIWNGTYENTAHLFDYLVDRVRIEADHATDFQIGGDSRGVRTTLSASVSKYPFELVDYRRTHRRPGSRAESMVGA